jgi:hypothetical protein
LSDLTVIRATDVGDIWHKVKQVVTMVRTVQERYEKVHPKSEAKETAASARPDWCAIYQVGMRAGKGRQGLLPQSGGEARR